MDVPCSSSTHFSATASQSWWLRGWVGRSELPSPRPEDGGLAELVPRGPPRILFELGGFKSRGGLTSFGGRNRLIFGGRSARPGEATQAGGVGYWGG